MGMNDRDDAHHVPAQAPIVANPESIGPHPDYDAQADGAALEQLHAVWDTRNTQVVTEPEATDRDRDVEGHGSWRSLVIAMVSLIVFGLIAAFFAWVSAAPFWLTVGHDVVGTVTVDSCHESQFAPRCTGTFEPGDGAEPVHGVRVTGDAAAKQDGATLSARATSATATSVYVGEQAGLWLRWAIPFGIIVGCGVAIAALTGAWRWRGRERLLAVSASLGGPVLLWLGALIMAW